MKIFLTGGRGMVGQNVQRLVRSRDDIKLLAPSSSELNLLDLQKTIDFVKAEKPDVVIHAAGLVGGIQANIKSPYDFCYVNTQIGFNLVQACMDARVDKLLNLGSSCMYPRNKNEALVESMVLSGELEPTNEGYAVAKIAVSKICEYASAQHGFLYKTIIPCNLYGYYDDFDPEYSHMIPGVIFKLYQAAQNNTPFVDIWGDGSARREFMFTQDLAEFILFAVENIEKLDSMTNVGLGFDYTINEYYQTIAKVVGFDGEFKHDLSKPTGMKRKLVDVSKQKKLGWQAPTSLEQGIEKTFEYYIKEVM